MQILKQIYDAASLQWCKPLSACHQLLEGINWPSDSAQNFGIRTNINHLK